MRMLFSIAVALLSALQTLWAVTAAPSVVIKPAPLGSAVTIVIDIVEDRNGDGVQDCELSRDENGRWVLKGIQSDEPTSILWDQVLPSSHYVFKASYDATHDVHSWVLTEYDNKYDMNETGRLERSGDSVIYTPAITRNTPGNQLQHYDSDRPDDFKAWTSRQVVYIDIEERINSFAQVKLLDVRGREVATNSFSVLQGLNHLAWSVGSIPNGVYYLYVQRRETARVQQIVLF